MSCPVFIVGWDARGRGGSNDGHIDNKSGGVGWEVGFEPPVPPAIQARHCTPLDGYLKSVHLYSI